MQTVKVSQIMEFCCCLFFAGGCSTINILHSSITSRVHWKTEGVKSLNGCVFFFRTAKLFLHQSRKKFNVLKWSWIQATEKRFESFDFYVLSVPANSAEIIFSVSSQDFSN